MNNGSNVNPNLDPNVNRNVKKTSNSGSSGISIIIITLLIIALVGAIGYILYSKVYVNNVQVVSTKEMLNTTKVEASGLYQVEDTVKTFEEAFNDYGSVYFGYIYNDDEITSSNFKNDAALFASIYNKFDYAPVVSYVPNAFVKETFKSIFGSSKTYKPSSIPVNDLFTIGYDDNLKYYSVLYPGVGGYFYPTYFSSLESTSLGEDYVYVVKNVGYIEFNNDGTFTIYKDSSKKKLVKTLKLKEGSFNPKELVARYRSKLSEYTYTFKMDGDNYTFEKIERTR